MRSQNGNLGAGPLVLALIGIALVGGIVWLAVVLFTGGEDQDTAPSNVTVDDLTEQRGRYVGRTVTVNNRIDEILSARAFTLEAEPGNTVVVVAKKPIEAISAPPISDGDLVRVTGQVTTTDDAEVDVQTEVPGEDSGGGSADTPAIVDAQVTPTPSRLPSDSRDLDVGEVTRNPREYLGERTTVNATVTKVVGPGAFVVGDKLLAVTSLEAADRLQKGERIQLTGTLRRFKPKQLKRDNRIDVPRAAKRRDDKYVLVVRGIDFSGGNPESGEEGTQPGG